MNCKILFLTDTNKKVGIGHIMRSIRLSKELSKLRTSIKLINKTKKNFKNFKNINIFKKIFFISNLDKIYNKIVQINPNLVIVDLPKPYINFERKLHLKKINFLIYDRLLRKKVYSDYLINLNPKVTKLHYQKKLIKNTKMLLGPKYFPINTKAKNKKISNKINQVLIFLGGGNNNLDILDKILKIINISKIKNSNINFLSMKKIDNSIKKKFIMKYNLNLKFLHNVKNIYDLIQEADLTIVTSGSISFESCYFNVPMILTSVAENQDQLAKSWDKLNAGIYVGRSNSKNFERGLEFAIKNIYYKKKRVKISNIQKKIFNKKKNYIVNLIKNLKK